MDYTSLTASKGTAGSIANWVNYSDAILPLTDILLDAQTLLYKGGIVNPATGTPLPPFRVHEMRTRTTVAVAQNAATAPLPPDHLETILLQDPYYNELGARDAKSIYRRQSVDSSGNLNKATYPTLYSIVGTQYVFDLAVSAAVNLPLTYYAQPALLSALAPSNILTTTYPHLLRRACLAVAADYLNDDAKYARYVNQLASMLYGVASVDESIMAGVQSDRDDYF